MKEYVANNITGFRILCSEFLPFSHVGSAPFLLHIFFKAQKVTGSAAGRLFSAAESWKLLSLVAKGLRTVIQ